ncbi:Dirigent protein [Heracleum sosnowskyi]|uniref:Dirigent protein n=1 Tax=Heracleum sosnowskyi TaxID=360622 RepID=A0AAD8MB99_9APIA|nr:Dirigent protein [Heracleum sosnowskyi]
MFVFSATVVAMPMARNIDQNLIIAMPTARCNDIDLSPEAVEEWIENLDNMEQTVTKLHFYLHDTISGENPPSVPVAKASSTDSSPYAFGLVQVIDDPLTEGPDEESPLIGRAQGLFVSSSMKDEPSLLISMNLYFTEGEFTNSTLNIEGRSPILRPYRELSVVGGSGLFRFARGLATVQPYSFNMTSRDAILEYHISVLHYVF